MSSDQDELKARLMKKAEEVVEAIVAGKRPAGENRLSDIERLAIRSGQAFEAMVTQTLADEEGEAEREAVCDTCGVRVRSRGKRKRPVVTEAGEVTVQRSSPGI